MVSRRQTYSGPGLRQNEVLVLIDETLGFTLESHVCLVVPPVLIVAVAIELLSHVVESVSDLVCDHCSDGSEIDITLTKSLFQYVIRILHYSYREVNDGSDAFSQISSAEVLSTFSSFLLKSIDLLESKLKTVDY